jgi:hypothetical protein
MRLGSVLIVVVGLSALFLSLSLMFIARMQGEAQESQMMQQEAQARIMLNAGLHYVQETSRLGWDDPATPEHEEAFGWIDVRDGQPGPRGFIGQDLAPVTNRFPAPGFAARCPMFVLERPPFALRTTFAYNPAPRDATKSWAELVSMKEPDPQPAAQTWDDFARGDARIRRTSLGMAWFRVYRHRDDPATRHECR